jgi:hypothetical protein
MTPAYCPVVSPSGTNHFAFSPYVTGTGTTCIHNAPTPITAYDAIYRDFLTLQGAGVQDGNFTDGEIAHAFRPDFKVFYSNGNGGIPVLGTGQWADLIGNMRLGCSGPVLCAAVSGLTCVSDCGTLNVQLNWTNNAVYTSIEVERNGALIATLGGGATSYTNLAVPGSTFYQYRVRGICAAGPAFQAVCSLQHCFTGPSILYCPSEADDPAYRTAIMNLSGGIVDYFDARLGSPDATLLANYDVAYTWANYAYFNNVEMGDNLASFVDVGGRVILGAFCTYTTGNFLSGTIMTDAYNPVVSPSGTNHFAMSPYVGDGVTCIHNAPWPVTNYDCVYRDFLTTQGTGIIDGTYADGEIGHAYRADFAVVYSNGSGASALGCPGEWPQLIANIAAGCGGPPPCCLPTVGLDCVLDCSNGNVTLTWNNLSVYANITIARDAVTIATIGGGLSTYTDTTAADGPHTWTVTGNCGPPCSASAFSVSCSLTVVSSGALPVVVWAAEFPDLVDSVAALEAELTAASIGYVQVANLADIPCADSGTVLFAMIGTFPADHVVTGAEGQYMRDLIAAGGCVYIESGDMWGFQGGAGAFYNADGIGSAFDGGDTFTGMTGSDYDLALCASLSSTYTQAGAGNDWTDQFTVSATDEFGPNAGQIWVDNDEGYITGVYYAAADPAGAVWNQSWEFGGYNGSKADLLEAILAALPCSSGPPVGLFKRGDINADTTFNIADPVYLLSALFVPGSPAPGCQDSADVNDDGGVNIADAVYALSSLFVPGSPPPPTPFPTCGSDGTADALTCITPNC